MKKYLQSKNKIKRYDYDKSLLIPVKTILKKQQKILSKPSWMKVKVPIDSNNIKNIKDIIRKNHLHSVCEEALCPNLAECFNNGTATFMILGKICTRRCPFCNVTKGRPLIPDINEPQKLSEAISEMKLNHVVLTSVNRDDLHDGGAQHFSKCINVIRDKNTNIIIEILVPDFRNSMNEALRIINLTPPDIFNHNLENVPRLYNQVRPGANYKHSIKLLEKFKISNPNLPTKSGLMVGLGETNEELIQVMRDLYTHGVTMLTIGQYLQPSAQHLPVKRYVSPKEFNDLKKEALSIGFTSVACGPFVRSSYRAALQAKGF